MSYSRTSYSNYNGRNRSRSPPSIRAYDRYDSIRDSRGDFDGYNRYGRTSGNYDRNDSIRDSRGDFDGYNRYSRTPRNYDRNDGSSYYDTGRRSRSGSRSRYNNTHERDKEDFYLRDRWNEEEDGRVSRGSFEEMESERDYDRHDSRHSNSYSYRGRRNYSGR